MKTLYWAMGLVFMCFCVVCFGQTSDPPINETGFGCSIKKGAAMDGGISLVPPGLWSSHWCLGSDNKYHLRINAVQAQNGVSMAPDFMKLQNLEGKAYDDALIAFMAKYPPANVKVTDPSVKDIWYPARATIFASKPADPTPPPAAAPTYAVAPNGTAKTRQWFAIDPVTLVLGAKTSGATVGQPCWPNVGGKIDMVDNKPVFYLPFGATEAKAVNTKVTVCVQTN